MRIAPALDSADARSVGTSGGLQRAVDNALNGRKMTQIKTAIRFFNHTGSMWNPITSAPSGSSLELAVVDKDGVHVLVFPCKKEAMVWKNAVTGAPVDVHPTHWRSWNPENEPGPSRDPH